MIDDEDRYGAEDNQDGQRSSFIFTVYFILFVMLALTCLFTSIFQQMVTGPPSQRVSESDSSRSQTSATSAQVSASKSETTYDKKYRDLTQN